MADRFHRPADQLHALSAYVKLMRAAETLSARVHRHLATSGLSVSQFAVLEALHHLGPLCQRDIGRKILKSSGNITTVIDNLERRQLVERRREGADRRYVAVHLSAAGEALIAGLFPAHAAGIVEAFSPLSPQEQAELARLCRKLGRGRNASKGVTP